MKTVSVQQLEPSGLDDSASSAVDHDDRLILWMLRRTPAQRLETLQDFVEGIMALRYAQKISQ